MRALIPVALLVLVEGLSMMSTDAAPRAGSTPAFEGKFYAGKGDVEYLSLLDTARRMLAPDPELQSLPMLYTPAWNGFVEGPTWGAWWIQNSYGPSYCMMPYIEEPYVTFLQNSQDLWFDQMGDGQRVGGGDWKWVPPDGCLCDAAAPGWIYYKQGDGRVAIHDWGMEFTAAGLVLQSEMLLVGRDAKTIAHYLPMLERVAAFIESRRDPSNDLFLAGPAGNLLAPSHAGWKKPDGTYDKAYLAGLSVTYIAGLDRLIELEKMAGHADRAARYADCRERARKGLAKLTTDEGYLIKYLDPDGTRHGVYGAEKYGYFEAVCNHDAVCFRVVDDQQAERIYGKMASIPGLRPHDLIITNYPSLDDMYEQPAGLWEFGRWVNGGHWSTCEARMMMAYYRLGKYDAARRSMERILGFARRYRLDNPMVDFGAEVYQPKEPINTVYDAWGIPAAMVRGLFEYLYRADGLTLIPHIPPGITELEQRFPVRFGSKRLILATAGQGPITGVRVNGRPWKRFDATSVFLPDGETPAQVRVLILMGGAQAPPEQRPSRAAAARPEAAPVSEELAELDARVARLDAFRARLVKEFPAEAYLAAHARLAVEWVATMHERRRLQAAGKLQPLAEEASQVAAERLFVDTGNKLCDGLGKVLQGYARSEDPEKERLFRLWREHAEAPGWVNIRASGATQTFRPHEGALRMSITGKPEASCGWAYDLDEPVELPAGSQLALEIQGSAGARFFVDLMTPEGKPCWQTLWQDTPQERKEVTFPLPAGLRIGQAILYTMNTGAEAWNDFHHVEIRIPDKPAVAFVKPAGKQAEPSIAPAFGPVYTDIARW